MPRLNKPIYESLPVLYLGVGVLLLWLSYRGRAAWWSNWCVGSGILALLGGMVVWMHRRDYRATSADYVRRGRPVEETPEQSGVLAEPAIADAARGKSTP